MENILQSLTSDAIATQGLDIGQRVRIANGKTGIIRHVGACHWAPGDFVGIELDSAHGKHDGTVDNVTYFVTKPKHALFVRPTDIDLLPSSSLSDGNTYPLSVASSSSSSLSSGSPASHTGSLTVGTKTNNPSTKPTQPGIGQSSSKTTARNSIVRTTPYVNSSNHTASSSTASLITQQKGLTGSMWSRSRQLEKIGQQQQQHYHHQSAPLSYASPSTGTVTNDDQYATENSNGNGDDVVSLERQIAILQQKLLQAQMQSSVQSSLSSPALPSSSSISSSPAVTVSAARSSAAVARSRTNHISPSLGTKGSSPLTSSLSYGKPSPTGSIRSISSRHTALTEILDLDIHHPPPYSTGTTTATTKSSQSPLSMKTNRSSSVTARNAGVGGTSATSIHPSSHPSGPVSSRNILPPKPVNNVTPPPPPPQLTKDTERKYPPTMNTSTSNNPSTEELVQGIREPSPIRKLSPEITDTNETPVTSEGRKEGANNQQKDSHHNHPDTDALENIDASALAALLVKVSEHTPLTETLDNHPPHSASVEVRENSLTSVSSNDTGDEHFGSSSSSSPNPLPTQVTFTATLSNTSKVVRPMGIARKLLTQANTQGTSTTGTTLNGTLRNKGTGVSSRSSSPGGKKTSSSLLTTNAKGLSTPGSVTSKSSLPLPSSTMDTTLGYNNESRISTASNGTTANQSSKVVIPSNRRAFTYGYGVSKRKEALLSQSSGGSSVTDDKNANAVNTSISSLPSTDAANDSQENITLHDLASHATPAPHVSGMRAYVLSSAGIGSSVNNSVTAAVPLSATTTTDETTILPPLPPITDSISKPVTKTAPLSARGKLLAHAATAKLSNKPPTATGTASSSANSVSKNRSSSSPRSRPLPTVGAFTAGMKSPPSSSATRGRSDSVHSSVSQSTLANNTDKTKLLSPRTRAMSVGRIGRTGPGSILSSPTAAKTRLRPAGVGSSPVNDLKLSSNGTLVNPYTDSIKSIQSPTKSTTLPTLQQPLHRTPPTVVVHASEATAVLPTLIGGGTTVIATRNGPHSPGRGRSDSLNDSASLHSDDDTLKPMDHPMHADEDVVSALVRSRLMSARRRRTSEGGGSTGGDDNDSDTGVALTNEKWIHGLRQSQPLSPITKSSSPRSSTPTRTKTVDEGPELYSGRKLSTAQFLKLSKATNLVTSSSSTSLSTPAKHHPVTGLMSPVTVDKPRGHVVATIGMNVEPISLTFPAYHSNSTKSKDDMIIDDTPVVHASETGTTMMPNAEAEEIMNRLRAKYGQGSLLESLTNKVLGGDPTNRTENRSAMLPSTDSSSIAKSTASSIASIAASAAAITAVGLVARTAQTTMLTKAVPQPPSSTHHHLFSPTLDNFAHYMPITPSVTNRKLLPSPQRNRSNSPSSSLTKPSSSRSLTSSSPGRSPPSKQRPSSPSTALASVFTNTGSNRSASPLSKHDKKTDFDTRDAATVAAAAAAMAAMAVVAKTVQATADGLVQASKQQQPLPPSNEPSSKGPTRRPPPPPVPVPPPLLGPSTSNVSTTTTTTTAKPVEFTANSSVTARNPTANTITLPPPALVLSIPSTIPGSGNNVHSPPSSPILDSSNTMRPTVPINRPPTPPRPSSPVQRPPSTPTLGSNNTNSAEGLPPLPLPPMLSQLTKTSVTVKVTMHPTTTNDDDDNQGNTVTEETTADKTQVSTKEAFPVPVTASTVPHKSSTLEPEVPAIDTVLPSVDTPREIAPSPPSEQPPVTMVETVTNIPMNDNEKMVIEEPNAAVSNDETVLSTVPQINVVKSYAGICEQGYNPSNPDKPCQDAIIMVEHPPTDSVMLAVFDGHGEDGHFVAQHFRDLIPDAVFSHKKFSDFILIADNIPPPSTSTEEIDQLADKVTKQNYKTSVLPPIGEPCLRRDVGGAIKSALLSVEKSLLARNDIDCSLSGCTGCIVVITGNHVTVANVGDSRAILVRTAPVNPNSNDGTSELLSSTASSSSLLRLVPAPLSIDHKPTMLSETKRILLAGGRVHAIKYDDGIEGPVRVWCKNEDVPGLAMSRSLGDVTGKKAGVSSIPDIYTYTLHDNDTFLVLASDGLWEFMSGLDITDIIGTTAAEAQLQLLAYTLAMEERTASNLSNLEPIPEPIQHLQLALDSLAEASGSRWQTREGVIDDISIIMAELGRVPLSAVGGNGNSNSVNLNE